MTINIKGIHKRLDKLKGHACEPDYEQEALDALSYEDLDALQEANALSKFGYSGNEITDMMGERWLHAEIAIERYRSKLKQLRGS